MRLPILIFASALLVPGAPFTRPTVAIQSDPAWEILCYGMVRPVSKKLKLRRDRNSTRVKDSIQLCTKHVYEFSGKAGQRIRLQLTGSEATWMILAPKNNRVFNQEKYDRVFSETREWNGALPSDAKYALTVVTAERILTPYTLELKFH